VAASLIQRISRDPRYNSEIGRTPKNLIDQVARVTLLERLPQLLRNYVDRVLRHAGFALD
jgi:hypothetical protein